MTWKHWVLVAAAFVVVVVALVYLLGSVGGPLAGGALGGLWAWLVGKRRKRTDPATAQSRLDDAVELGQHSIAAADAEADKAVEDGMVEHGSLAEYLNDRTGNTR